MQLLFQKKVFYRFFFSYVVIIFITALGASYVMRVTYDAIEEEIVHSHRLLLNQTRSVLDERLMHVDDLIVHLNWDPSIRNLIFYGADRDSTYAIRQVLLELMPYYAQNEDMFIYFRDIDVLMSPKVVYTRLGYIYGSLFQYGDFDLDTFREEILYKPYSKNYLPTVPVKLDKRVEDRIVCLQTLPLEMGENGKAKLLYFIDVEDLQEQFNLENMGDNAYSCIIDSKGQVLYDFGELKGDYDIEQYLYSGFKEEISKDNNVLVTTVVSPYNQWRYVTLLPKKSVLAKMAPMRVLYSVFLLWSILGGGLLAYILAYGNFKPIKELVVKLKGVTDNEEQETLNEYGYINKVVQYLKDTHLDQLQIIDEELPKINHYVYHKLLNGQLQSWNNSIFEKDINILKNWGSCGVVLVRSVLEGEFLHPEIIGLLHLKMLAIKAYIEESMNVGILVEVDEYTLALLLPGDLLSQELDPRELEFNIKEHVSMDYGMTIIVGTGQVYKDVHMLHHSYFQAIEVLNYNQFHTKTQVYRYEDIERQPHILYYSVEREAMLIGAVNQGDVRNTKIILGDIYEDNFGHHVLDTNMLRQLFFELKGTLYKLKASAFNEKTLNDDALSIAMEASNWKQCFFILEKEFIDRAVHAFDQKNKSQEQLANDLREYLATHYQNKDMGLVVLADEFQRSSVYISQFFKDHMGENFSTYLERLRISKASQLLVDSKLTINDIADEVGYYSSHTFRRAFKREKGVSPSAYRQGF